MAKILIVDDQPMILKCLKSALTADGHDIATVTAGDLALRLVGFTSFDVIITDYAMPGMDGLKFLEIARQRSPGVPVIMITGFGTADTAIQAMAKGAFDYLTKPVSLESLRTTVNAALEYIRARNEICAFSSPSPELLPYCNVVAASSAMSAVAREVGQLSRSNINLILEGETGTGKETIARVIHAYGIHKTRTFEKIDCPMLFDQIRISHLLGAGEVGTVFLREVSAMPMEMQKELLRILRSRSYAKGDGSTSQPLTARIICTTSTPLGPRAENGTFNQDLLRILSEHILRIPPLRERPEDIRVYIGLTLRSMDGKTDGVAPIEPEALMVLERYPWPGNLPELEEAIRNASTMAKGGLIGISHLPNNIVREVSLEGVEELRKIDLKQFRGRVVKKFLQGRKQEFRDMIQRIEDLS